jgi:hypothetical protein
MTTSLLHVSMLAFLAALAIDYKKIFAYTRVEIGGHPFMPKLGQRSKHAMTLKQYDDRIAIKDPYDLFETIHSRPPVRIHQPIHVISIRSLVLKPEISEDPQDRNYRMPFGSFSDRAVIFADQRTVVKTTKSVISDLRRDSTCIAIIAAGDTTMRIFIYDSCDDAFFIKITSIYRHTEYKHESIQLENAMLYIVK